MEALHPYTYQVGFDQNGDYVLIKSSQQLSPEALWQVGQILAQDVDPLFNVETVIKAEVEVVPEPTS